MLVIKKCAQSEQIIKGSRFLAESFVVETQAQAREKISAQKKKYADATHVCHAFVCGKNGEILGMSDDGEPSGTAGRPMLDVLKGKNCTNTLVTVTRWFGGTLLGTGGLVKAYGDGAKNVLSQTIFEEFIEKTDFKIECGYEKLSVIKKTMEDFSIFDLTEDFGEKITIRGKIPKIDFDNFSKTIFDKSNGKIPVLSE